MKYMYIVEIVQKILLLNKSIINCNIYDKNHNLVIANTVGALYKNGDITLIDDINSSDIDEVIDLCDNSIIYNYII